MKLLSETQLSYGFIELIQSPFSHQRQILAFPYLLIFNQDSTSVARLGVINFSPLRRVKRPFLWVIPLHFDPSLLQKIIASFWCLGTQPWHSASLTMKELFLFRFKNNFLNLKIGKFRKNMKEKVVPPIRNPKPERLKLILIF